VTKLGGVHPGHRVGHGSCCWLNLQNYHNRTTVTKYWERVTFVQIRQQQAYPCSWVTCAVACCALAQGRTILLLTHLVRSCTLECPRLLHNLLELARSLAIAELRQQYSPLTEALMARLREAADAGRFSDPASSLTGAAVDMAYGILGTMGTLLAPFNLTN
jgi:hypothetical protein